MGSRTKSKSRFTIKKKKKLGKSGRRFKQFLLLGVVVVVGIYFVYRSLMQSASINMIADTGRTGLNISSTLTPPKTTTSTTAKSATDKKIAAPPKTTTTTPTTPVTTGRSMDDSAVVKNAAPTVVNSNTSNDNPRVLDLGVKGTTPKVTIPTTNSNTKTTSDSEKRCTPGQANTCPKGETCLSSSYGAFCIKNSDPAITKVTTAEGTTRCGSGYIETFKNGSWVKTHSCAEKDCVKFGGTYTCITGSMGTSKPTVVDKITQTFTNLINGINGGNTVPGSTPVVTKTETRIAKRTTPFTKYTTSSIPKYCIPVCTQLGPSSDLCKSCKTASQNPPTTKTQNDIVSNVCSTAATNQCKPRLCMIGTDSLPICYKDPNEKVDFPDKSTDPYNDGGDLLAQISQATADAVKQCQIEHGEIHGEELKQCFCSQLKDGCPKGSVADDISIQLAATTSLDNDKNWNGEGRPPSNLECMELVCSVLDGAVKAKNGTSSTICNCKRDQASGMDASCLPEAPGTKPGKGVVTNYIYCPIKKLDYVNPGEIVQFKNNHIGLAGPDSKGRVLTLVEANYSTVDGRCEVNTGCVDDERKIVVDPQSNIEGIWSREPARFSDPSCCSTQQECKDKGLIDKE